MWRLLAAALLAYSILVLLACALQPKLLYLRSVPGRELEAAPSDAGLPFDQVRIETADGVRLHGWFLPAQLARATLLFFHGNAGNISHRLDSLRIFHDLGLSVLIIDYRGFGRSEGTPSERGTARDARAAWRYLVTERSAEPERIVVFGRSLGAAIRRRQRAQAAARPAWGPQHGLPAVSEPLPPGHRRVPVRAGELEIGPFRLVPRLLRGGLGP